MTTIIHEDDDIQVLHQPGGPGFSLVTFGGLTDRPSSGPEGPLFWGQAPAGKLGLDTVGVLAKAENWYPASAMQRAAPAIRAVLRPEAVGYGFSMGGYAALKYGALLGLGTALAVSPQGSISPHDIPADARHHKRFLPHRHAGMAVDRGDLAGFAVQIVDPYEAEDLAQADFIAGRAPVVTLTLPFLSHATIWHLAETDMLGRVLELVRARDVAGLRRALRAHRAQSAHWARLLGRAAFIRGRPERAERLWQRASALGLNQAWMNMERAAALEGRSWRLSEAAGAMGEAAEAHLLEAAQLCRGNAPTLLRLARRLAAFERHDSAIRLLRQAIRLAPQGEAAHLELMRALAADRQPVAALEAALEAAGQGFEGSAVTETLGAALAAAPEEAVIPVLQRVIDEAPAAPVLGVALLQLGHLMLGQGALEEALRLAERAAATLPENDQPLLLQWKIREAMELAATAPHEAEAPALATPGASRRPGLLGWLGGRFGRGVSSARG